MVGCIHDPGWHVRGICNEWAAKQPAYISRYRCWTRSVNLAGSSSAVSAGTHSLKCRNRAVLGLVGPDLLAVGLQ